MRTVFVGVRDLWRIQRRCVRRIPLCGAIWRIYGVYDWGNGKNLEIDFVRQLIKDEDIIQIHITLGIPFEEKFSLIENHMKNGIIRSKIRKHLKNGKMRLKPCRYFNK